MSGLIALVVVMFPSIQETEGLESDVENLPDAFSAAIGCDVAFTTMEGLRLIEVLRLTWMLIVGTYFAYVSAGFAAGEV